MRIFQDLFTGSEIISDSYKMNMMFEDTTCEIMSRMVVKGEENVDVGCGNAFGGTNQDEEPSSGGIEKEKVNDLVDAFNYQEAGIGKADWNSYFKDYVKKLLKEIKPERQDSFKKGAMAFRKHIVDNFDEITIYTPQDYDAENSLIYSYWKNQTDSAPTFIFFLDGCKVIKL